MKKHLVLLPFFILCSQTAKTVPSQLLLDGYNQTYGQEPQINNNYHCQALNNIVSQAVFLSLTAGVPTSICMAIQIHWHPEKKSYKGKTFLRTMLNVSQVTLPWISAGLLLGATANELTERNYYPILFAEITLFEAIRRIDGLSTDTIKKIIRKRLKLS